MRLRHALQRFRVAGLPTNLTFLRAVAGHAALAAGDVHTDFIQEHAKDLLPDAKNVRSSPGHLALAGAAWRLKESSTQPEAAGFRVNLASQRHLRLEMAALEFAILFENQRELL